jgi:cation diffusion facilitator family transporter
LKIIAGLLTGSVSIISEAIHSGMDLAASLIAFFSVNAAAKPPDKNHPYGHGKIENVSGIIEGLLIFSAAVLIIVKAIDKIQNPQPLVDTEIAVIVMVFSAVVNTIVSRILYKTAKKEHSVALEADALHLKTDVLTSAGVALGIILLKLTGWYILDPIAAVLVALLIIKEAFFLCAKAFNPLLDISISEEEEKWILCVLDQHKDVICGFHNLKTRQAGNHCYAEFHLEMDPAISIEQYQEISNSIINNIEEKLKNITVTIHVEREQKTSGNYEYE